MKDAIEIYGCLTPKDSYILVPSGNHRNQQRVQMKPASGGGPGQHCPRCKAKLSVWVHTFPTEFYEVWKTAAIKSILRRYKPGEFSGPVVVYAWVFGGSGFMESRDWDNVQKCVGDALAEAEVLPAPKGKAIGDDDVRSIKGWRTFYLDRAEHVARVPGAKTKDVRARLFIQLVDAKLVDPFTV